MATPLRINKAERDRIRQRPGNKHRKRLHVLQTPKKLAFRGWNEVLDPWSFKTCTNYIEWCYIDKAFSKEWYNYHYRFHKANLKYCIDEAFKQRCIEVYQVLYKKSTMKKNEVYIFLVRGVHVEVRLNKWVDWSTLKGTPMMADGIKIPILENGIIAKGVMRYPKGGLGKINTRIEPLDMYETSDSATDDNSDGSHTIVELT